MKKTKIALLFVAGYLSASSLQSRGLNKDFGTMKRALGWEALNLKAVEKDSSDRPTLERDSNALNNVERKISYRSNGKKQSQSVTVVSKLGGKLLYDKKEWWNALGDLEHSYVQDNCYSKEGNRLQGESHELSDSKGKLTKEVGMRYFEDLNRWKKIYSRSVTYYDNGDMKERFTEDADSNDAKRESWGEKLGSADRKKITQTSKTFLE